MDVGQTRNPGRQHQFLELQLQLSSDFSILRIERVADAETEGVARRRITIRPIQSRLIQADGVDVEKFFCAGAAGVVTKNQPTINVDIETKRSL